MTLQISGLSCNTSIEYLIGHSSNVEDAFHARARRRPGAGLGPPLARQDRSWNSKPLNKINGLGAILESQHHLYNSGNQKPATKSKTKIKLAPQKSNSERGNQTMPSGGNRPGSGRPKGTKNGAGKARKPRSPKEPKALLNEKTRKQTAKIVDRALQEGPEGQDGRGGALCRANYRRTWRAPRTGRHNTGGDRKRPSRAWPTSAACPPARPRALVADYR